MKIIKLLSLLTFSGFLLTTSADAQFGGIKVKKPKVPKITTKSTPSASSASPASTAINYFNENAERLQHCIDNNTWEHEGDEYDYILKRAKSSADKVKEKDPISYKKISKRYDTYQAHWDNNQDVYAVYKAQNVIKQFEGYAENLQYCIDNKVWQDANKNKYSSNLSSASNRVEELKKKIPNDVAQYEERLATYQKHWDTYQKELADAKEAAEKAEAAKVEAFLTGPVKDDGITSDLHKKYVNKIVFSNEKINLDNPEESKIKTEVGISKPIFMRMYIDKSMGNYYRQYAREKRDGKEKDHWEYFYYSSKRGEKVDGVETREYTASSQEAKLLYKVFINGKEYDTWRKEYASYNRNTEVVDNWTSWWTEIIPVKEERYYDVSDPVDFFGEYFAYANPGTHKIKVEMWLTHHDNTSEILDKLAEGEVTVKFTEAEQKAYRKTRGRLMLKAGMTDSSLESKMRAMLMKEHPDVKIKRTVIVSKTWKIHKNDFDLPTKKMLWTDFAVTKDGECRIITAGFRRDYAGGGTYEAMYMSTSTDFEESERIHCDDIFVKP
ncbi:MAG: hypothetical protein MK212_00365 [Saprospiraceae bacterium]|nr:hypothetical protein [Saprospiraceae bacterium]